MARNPRIRVLIADDDARMRSALAELIKRERTLHLVGAVADAAAAVELAERERPDVALVDVRMPRGGGAKAAREIRRRSPATRVIALSVHDDRQTVLQMLEAGVVGYLVKGSSIDGILEAISHAVEGQASLSVEVTADVVAELVKHQTSRQREQERERRRRARIERILLDESRAQVVFQPICMLTTGEVPGAEALARFAGPPWRSPDLWFAEAREVGLRHELELLAARCAVEQLPDLPDGVYLSLNASPEAAVSSELLELLAGADAQRIVLEITEHAPVSDYDAFNVAVARLRKLGVRLAIDDAGAGFASLRHVLQMAPDFIKLDRTLIEGIAEDQLRQALAVGLISFADRVGATIIAEGIETDAQLATLVELGVGCGQGYLFARPAPLPLEVSLPAACQGSSPRRGRSAP